MFNERTAVGLDVHARSVTAEAVDGVTGEVVQARLGGSVGEVLDWVEGVRGARGPVAVAYEAGPTGFGLARALEAAGIRCVVAAPSKMVRPSGDRITHQRGWFTDVEDARAWAGQVIDDYNTHHRHSSLEGHTPASVHDGTWIQTHHRWQATMDDLAARNPRRYPKQPQLRAPHTVVTLNLRKDDQRLQTA